MKPLYSVTLEDEQTQLYLGNNWDRAERIALGETRDVIVKQFSKADEEDFFVKEQCYSSTDSVPPRRRVTENGTYHLKRATLEKLLD